MQSEYRDQLIETIFQAHYIKFALQNQSKALKIFGISAPTLKEFVTTDKDLLRKIDRKPCDDYLLDVLGLGISKK